MDQFDEKLKSHLAGSANRINIEPVGAADVERRGVRRTRRRRVGGAIGVVAAVVAGSVGVRPLITGGGSTLDVAAEKVVETTTAAPSSQLAAPPSTDAALDTQLSIDGYGSSQWILPWGEGFLSLTSTWDPESAEAPVDGSARLAAQVSADGLTWWSVESDIQSTEGAGAIIRAVSDGTHLIIGRQSETDSNGLTIWVTDNLTDWQTTDVSSQAVDQLAYITSDSWLSNLAIGPDGWFATVETNSYIDPWALLPDEVRNWPGGFELQEVADGLSVSLYASAGPSDGPMPFDVGEPTPDTIVALEEDLIAREEYVPQIGEQRLYTWSELGIDPVEYAADKSAMAGASEETLSTASVWVGGWGETPLSSPTAGAAGEGLNQVIGTDAGFLAIKYDRSNGDATLLFSPNGIVWTETELPPDMPFGGGLSNIVAVRGGVLASVYDRDTYVVWRGAPDGTGWIRAELPASISQHVALYSEGGGVRGFVGIVDTASYQDLRPPQVEFDVAIEVDGSSVHLFAHADDTADLVITDLATGEVVAEVSGAFDGLAAEFARVDGDTVTIIDAEGNDVLVLPTQEVADALASARQQAIDDSGWTPPPISPRQPELVVAATADGLTWTATPLEDVFADQQYPMAIGGNENTVVMRFEDQWHTLPIG